MTTFRESLDRGLAGESRIARFLVSRGNAVLPIEVPESPHKGPRIWTAGGRVVSPDMLVFNRAKNTTLWVEAKTKSAFTWHHKRQKFQTGINRHHYNEYLRVREESGWEVWLLFLHEKGHLAKDTPDGMVSPHGLFCGEVSNLQSRVDHVDLVHGTELVFWNHEALTHLADEI